MKRLIWLAVLMAPVWALGTPVELVSVTDGDTVEISIDGKTEKLRLIGVDTPEMAQAPYGQKAKEALAGLVAGKELGLVLGVEQRDKYGRLLGYLYAGDTLVNQALLEQGWAVLLTIPPNVEHVDEFQKAQETARAQGKGIWSPSDPLNCMPGDFRHGDCDAPAEAPDSAKPQQEVYYPNCAAVRAAGKAPLRSNQPGYRSKLDRDGDGMACE